MTLLTNPNSVDHGFDFNHVNRPSGYDTPLSGSYSYVYDGDRRLVETNFPSGKQIRNIYTETLLTQIQTPEGNIDLTYECGNNVGSITNAAGESIAYTYDGTLTTSEAFSGTLNESLGYAYNNDFNLSSFTYAGGTANYGYDQDGLLTESDGFTITRNAANGLPESVTGGSATLSRGFNGYGEVESSTINISGTDMVAWSLVRDDNGRITGKTETAGGITADYVYTYDQVGRLLTVTKDGSLVEEYAYVLPSSLLSYFEPNYRSYDLKEI
jgi:YD repeat-containing protein